MPNVLTQTLANLKSKEYRDQIVQKNIEGVKQFGAGAALPFMDSPSINGDHSFDGYSPVAIDMLPALVGAVGQMVKPGSNIPYATNALKRVSAASDTLNNALGIQDPTDPAMIAANLAGGLIIPAGAPGKGLKAVKAATLAGKAANAAKTTARVAADMVVPFRQTGVKTALATQVPFGLGLNALAQDHAKKSGLPLPEDKHAEAFDPAKVLDPQMQGELEVARLNGDQNTEHEIMQAALDAWEANANDPEQVLKDVAPEPDWKGPAAKIVLAAAGIGLGAWGVKQAITKARLNHTSALTGLQTKEQLSSLPTKMVAGLAQADQPVRSAVKGAVNPVEFEKFKAKLDAITTAPMNTRIQHSMVTGEMPNSSIAVRPLASSLEAMTKSVTPQESQVISDGLLARNALDDISKTGTQAAFNDKTPEELTLLAQRLENDPKLAKWGTQIKQHYRDQLDYLLDRGMITPEMHRAFIDARPNFVHMSKTATFDDNFSTLFGQGSLGAPARNQMEQLLARSTDEFGGVQVGAAADPIRELPGQLASIVKKAEVNDIKKQFFDIAANNAELSKFVSKVPKGEQPHTRDGLHTIYRNGVAEHYIVKDPALSTALEFTPNVAKTAFASLFGPVKKLTETMITGAGAPLFSGTSAAYDTITGIMLRPKGFDLGLLNEGLNRAGSPVTLGGFDPTVWLSAPVGALRLAGDSLTESLAQDLTTRLMKDHDWFVQAVGPQNAQALQARLASSYQASIKANMDRYGATSAGLFDAADPTHVGHGMADIAPTFYSASSKKAWEEAVQGNANFITGLMKGGKSLFEQARASSIARAYLGTVKLLHEGFRYQAFATNLPKAIGDDDLMKMLASKTRRVTADIAQTGSSQAYKELASGAMYLNTGVQSLAEVARKIKDQPVTTLTNMTTALASLLAMQYAWAASHPDNAKEIADMSDDQQTRMAKTFGGMDIPVPPELRPVWGPLTALMNEMSGLTEGDFDPNFASAFEEMIDNGVSEEGVMSVRDSLKAGLDAASPVNVGSFPLLNAGAATQGVDLGMTKFTGKPQAIQGQKLSQLAGEGQLTDDAMSATAQHMINDLLGTTVANYARAAMDAERAMGAGASTEDAAKVAWSRFLDNTEKAAGPTRGMLFGGYENVRSMNDTTEKMYHKKDAAIDKIGTIFRQDLKQQFVTGADPRYAMLRAQDTVLPEYQNTMLLPIGAITADMSKAMAPLKSQLNTYKKQADEVKNQKTSTIQERNKQINDWNDQQRDVIQQLLIMQRMAEDQIREVTGDKTFTYQNFDPDKYKEMSYPPAVATGPPTGGSPP